jgi:hypothetical protein
VRGDAAFPCDRRAGGRALEGTPAGSYGNCPSPCQALRVRGPGVRRRPAAIFDSDGSGWSDGCLQASGLGRQRNFPPVGEDCADLELAAPAFDQAAEDRQRGIRLRLDLGDVRLRKATGVWTPEGACLRGYSPYVLIREDSR